MEGSSTLFSLTPGEKEWHIGKEEKVHHAVSEDKKLELRLGPPGEDQSLHSQGYFSKMASNNNIRNKRAKCLASEHQCQNIKSSENSLEKVFSSPWTCGSLSSSSAFQRQTQKLQQLPKASFLRCPLSHQSLNAAGLQYLEEKACSAAAKASVTENIAVPNSPQKRVALASDSAIGWPPIRSFRKNLAYGRSSKLASKALNEISKEVAALKSENFENGLFVKVNMDGIPIGRKVDLKAYHSYEQLSCAVDELFSGLLAAQRDSSVAGHEVKLEEAVVVRDSLDPSGEYTLVYEDGEGDRMLVGDVPWHMFVSTAKRLRVLKSSELSALCFCSNTQEKTLLDSAVEFGS